MAKTVEERRQYDREWYHKNKLRIKPAKQCHLDRQRQRARVTIWNYLSTHPCVDCGEKDILVLDFDHVRGEKKFGIGNAVRLGYSLSVIELEIVKCEVRCANCHRRKTARQLGFDKKIEFARTQANGKQSVLETEKCQFESDVLDLSCPLRAKPKCTDIFKP